MADGNKPPAKKSSASPKAPPAKKAPPADAGPAGPPPGASDPMATGMGVQPPMPGSGMDPYAALTGQVSNISPIGQPGGFGGMPADAGMGPPGGSEALPGGAPTDPIQAALMSSASPMSFPPDIGEDWDPGSFQGLSLNQILTMLSLMQGGIPSSGLTPMARPGSGAAGMVPTGVMG